MIELNERTKLVHTLVLLFPLSKGEDIARKILKISKSYDHIKSMAPPTVRSHLKDMEAAGWVKSSPAREKQGVEWTATPLSVALKMSAVDIISVCSWTKPTTPNYLPSASLRLSPCS